jgi:copper(I)-binding protein
MTVRNTGDSAVKLLGATTQPQSTVEIHTSREVDGMIRMERLKSVALAPGHRVQFAPGGMHFMVLGLEKMPAPGESLKLCLQFDTGVPACALAEVRRLAPAADDDMHDNHQHH